MKLPYKMQLVRIAAAAMAAAIWLLHRTMKLHVITADGLKHPVDPRIRRYCYAFWHEAMLAPLATKPKVRVLISRHADGELIAEACRRLGLGAVRGSTARYAITALLEMIRSDDATHLAITPDGPRGPRRELKPGLVLVSSESGIPIVPTGVAFTYAWRARSWDRFAVPLPFTTMVILAGQPIEVPANIGRAEIARYADLVQEQMLELTEQAEDWAQRLRQEGALAPPPNLKRVDRLLKSA